MRIRDYGYTIGELPTGKYNRITDVPGVKVGHTTIRNENHNTGVTVIMPCEDNPFVNKLTCASYVLNGFGKTCGLIQVDELGTLETPIALTNTLNVGKVSDALITYMIDRCKADNAPLMSINPVVCECNDGWLNDIQDRVVGYDELKHAIDTACVEFEEGAVGGGTGMTCHGLKGGIGSSSRQLTFDDKTYTVGALVQCNHGRLKDLRINGEPIGERIQLMNTKPDKGSCIVVLGTDLPVSEHQLQRLLKRVGNALARVGSYTTHGSGEVFLAFTTANRVDARDKAAVREMHVLNDDYMNDCFYAVVESTEEALLNALSGAITTSGPEGHTSRALAEYLK